MTEPLTLYTSAEVAQVLRLNHQVVQRKLQAGEIPAYRIGREWRVERAQLVQWLEERSNQRDPVDRWFDKSGKLTALPAKRSARLPILNRLIEEFEPNRTYAEKEVNAVLRRFHDDVASLRREMVGVGLFVRTPDGVYKRIMRGQSALPSG
jgi:excisionase family DNA binding protein